MREKACWIGIWLPLACVCEVPPGLVLSLDPAQDLRPGLTYAAPEGAGLEALSETPSEALSKAISEAATELLGAARSDRRPTAFSQVSLRTFKKRANLRPWFGEFGTTRFLFWDTPVFYLGCTGSRAGPMSGVFWSSGFSKAGSSHWRISGSEDFVAFSPKRTSSALCSKSS